MPCPAGTVVGSVWCVRIPVNVPKAVREVWPASLGKRQTIGEADLALEDMGLREWWHTGAEEVPTLKI